MKTFKPICVAPSLGYWELDGKPISAEEAQYGLTPGVKWRETIQTVRQRPGASNGLRSLLTPVPCLEVIDMLVSCALNFAEHLRFLESIQDRYLTPVLATHKTFEGICRLGTAVRNHFGAEFTTHYIPVDVTSGGYYYIAVSVGRLAKTKVRDARLFGYAYHQGWFNRGE